MDPIQPHLCISKWSSRSLTIFSWIMGASCYCPSLSSSSGCWIPGEKLVLLLNIEAKKALSTLRRYLLRRHLPFPHPWSLCFSPHPIKDGDYLEPCFCCECVYTFYTLLCTHLCVYSTVMEIVKREPCSAVQCFCLLKLGASLMLCFVFTLLQPDLQNSCLKCQLLKISVK